MGYATVDGTSLAVKRTGINSEHPSGYRWEPVSGPRGPLSFLDCSGENQIAIDVDGKAHAEIKNKWKEIPTFAIKQGLSHVTSGVNYTLALQRELEELLIRDVLGKGEWERFDSLHAGLKLISMSWIEGQQLWGVAKNGDVWVRLGLKDSRIGTTWVHIVDKQQWARDISVAMYGNEPRVLVVDNDGGLWYRVQFTPRVPFGQGWKQLSFDRFALAVKEKQTGPVLPVVTTPITNINSINTNLLSKGKQPVDKDTAAQLLAQLKAKTQARADKKV